MRPGQAFWTQADCRALPYPDQFFHCCVTSPPYYRQRKYGDDGKEIGREQSPDEFAESIASSFDEVRRVLRDDGVVFLNIGDTYASSPSGSMKSCGLQGGKTRQIEYRKTNDIQKPIEGIPQKSQIGIPWRVAFAMMRRGWILRQEIIWGKSISFGDRHAAVMRAAVIRQARKLKLSKITADALAEVIEPQVGSCMPGSATDRCTTSHEQLFLFAKSPRYFADMEAVKEKGKDWGARDRSEWKYNDDGYAEGQQPHSGCADNNFAEKGRNLRSVWTIGTQPVRGMSHYAAFPVRLVEPCIKIGTSAGGCCPACGAPMERAVERTKLTRARPNDYTKREGEDGTGNACANTVDGVATRTIGWQVACKCADAGDPVPCRVLDNYGGTGTAAVAGVPLGRDVHVVDLYEKYLIEGRQRFADRVSSHTKGEGE